MATAKTTRTTTPESAEAVFTREQLAASRRYAKRRDLIMALLAPGKTYTLNEADSLVDGYMKGKVK